MDSRQEAFTTWLKTYNWDYFFTTTFRSRRREPYYALKNVYRVLKTQNVVRAFLVAEPHKSGDLHLHGLLSGPTGLREGEMYLPWYIETTLSHFFGYSKVEMCNSQEAVAGYCAKYVMKSQHIADHFEVFGAKRWWKKGKA